MCRGSLWAKTSHLMLSCYRYSATSWPGDTTYSRNMKMNIGDKPEKSFISKLCPKIPVKGPSIRTWQRFTSWFLVDFMNGPIISRACLWASGDIFSCNYAPLLERCLAIIFDAAWKFFFNASLSRSSHSSRKLLISWSLQALTPWSVNERVL